MTVYIYLEGWERSIKNVSVDREKIYKEAWEDFKNAIGLEEITNPSESEVFENFISNGGIDDWKIEEWEI